MTDAAPAVRVVDNPGASRFDAFVGDELAGFAEYRLRPGRIVFTHTEVDDAFEGHGVGSALVRQMLDQLRERTDVTVATSCPFVRAWLRRHPDYQELTRR